MRKRPDLIVEVGNFVGDAFVPAPVSKPQSRPSVQAVDDFTTRPEVETDALNATREKIRLVQQGLLKIGQLRLKYPDREESIRRREKPYERMLEALYAQVEADYTIPQKIVYRRRRTLARVGGSVWWCDLIVKGL